MMVDKWIHIYSTKNNLVSEEVDTAPFPQWIPVSEMLPEEDGDYITTTMDGQVFCDYWNGLNFNRTETVIAWMPLPEPLIDPGLRHLDALDDVVEEGEEEC